MKLTAQHVCDVTGWSRDQLRAVLADLPPFRDWKSEARVARRFSPADLLFLAAVAHLERDAGLKRSAISRVALALRDVLASRSPAMSFDAIFVSLSPPTVTVLDDSMPEESGLVIQLSPIARKVHEYFGMHEVKRGDKQVALRLRSADAAGRRA